MTKEEKDRRAEVRALLIEMRRYVIYHGILIGECVAWNKLKDLFGIVNEGMPEEGESP